MLLSALTSRSCAAPQWQQFHPLIPRPALPFGLLAGMIPQQTSKFANIESLGGLASAIFDRIVQGRASGGSGLFSEGVIQTTSACAPDFKPGFSDNYIRSCYEYTEVVMFVRGGRRGPQ